MSRDGGPIPARLTRLSDVQPQSISWLWRSRIPLGMLTLLDGDPGLGKSTITADLAARITTGTPMPTETDARDPADVILMSAEDHVASVIRPRLDAARADTARVHVLDAMPESEEPDAAPTLSADHIERLSAAIDSRRARLVVIDPLMAHLPPDVDAHRDEDVRRMLRRLTTVAERTGAAILIVRHLRKTSGPALYRGGGSIGIVGAARLAMLAAVDPVDPTGRLLAVSKSNVGQIPRSLKYRIVEAGEVGRVDWGVEVDVSADELAAVADPDDEQSSGLVDATAALRKVLDAGPIPTTDAEEKVRKETGVSKRTFERARQGLGVVSTRESGGWVLSLPTFKTATTSSGEGVGGVPPMLSTPWNERTSPGKTATSDPAQFHERGGGRRFLERIR